jgi:predicted nucleic acid-binding Zn ribbon protein
VHFKGSGFYTTDYGRGSRKKPESGKDGGDSGSPAASESGEKKAAAADG